MNEELKQTQLKPYLSRCDESEHSFKMAEFLADKISKGKEQYKDMTLSDQACLVRYAYSGKNAALLSKLAEYTDDAEEIVIALIANKNTPANTLIEIHARAQVAAMCANWVMDEVAEGI